LVDEARPGLCNRRAASDYADADTITGPGVGVGHCHRSLFESRVDDFDFVAPRGPHIGHQPHRRFGHIVADRLDTPVRERVIDDFVSVPVSAPDSRSDPGNRWLP
jgi:hypothetical protein